MSKEMEELRRTFQQRFGGSGDTVFQGTVTEVNEDEFTCTVQRDGQVDYFDVRLRGLVKAELQGFAFIPKLQSTVLVCRIGKSNELFVCMFTEIDKMYFTDNDWEVVIDTEKLDAKKGENITVHVDAEKLEVTNGKVKALHEADALTVTAGSTTVKASTGGATITRGGSGLKKTLDDMLAAIQTHTHPCPMGSTSAPTNAAQFASIRADLPNYLEG